jgi:hypothetical protein
MAARKFRDGDRVAGCEVGPAAFRGRVGTIVDFRGRGGYGVKFDDTDIIEYLQLRLAPLIEIGQSKDQSEKGLRCRSTMGKVKKWTIKY